MRKKGQDALPTLLHLDTINKATDELKVGSQRAEGRQLLARIRQVKFEGALSGHMYLGLFGVNV